jgi:hypothetical protein
MGQLETRRVGVTKPRQCNRNARMSKTISVLKCAQQFAGAIAELYQAEAAFGHRTLFPIRLSSASGEKEDRYLYMPVGSALPADRVLPGAQTIKALNANPSKHFGP